MKNQIKWLFFDVGSTLIDEGPAYEYRLRDIARLAGVPYETVREKALTFYHENKKGDLETAKFFGISLPPWHTEAELLYPDAEQTLSALHPHYKIGIIANQLPGTEARLRSHGLLRHIDLVIASAEEGVSKPDPKIFQIALARADCKPHEAVMIGDRIDNDILPANLLGMHTIWIRQGFGQYWNITQKEENPDASVKNLTELCKIL